MSSSAYPRWPRAGSPTGRRPENASRAPAAANTTRAYGMPSSYKHRDSITSPPRSGVIPLPTETYVNGTLVDSSRPRDYDTYSSYPRRASTLDVDPPRAAPASSSYTSSAASSTLRPAVVHQSGARGPSPAPKGGSYDAYVTPASSIPSRREHKKIYSIDDNRASRLIDRDSNDTRRYSALPSTVNGPRHGGYHRRGGLRATHTSNIDDYGVYDFTDARGMFRDTEPKWRNPRRNSVDASSRRERPSSLVESSQGNLRAANREGGPPPSTRGFDKMSGSNVGRHESLRAPAHSPPRERQKHISQDDNYPVAPRAAPGRIEMPSLPQERIEREAVYSPTRADALHDDSRLGRRSRFEDTDLASRGFGIRAPSIDARRSQDQSLDRTSGYDSRRDYYPEDSRREADWYRERDREPPRRETRDVSSKDKVSSKDPGISDDYRDRRSPPGSERSAGVREKENNRTSAQYDDSRSSREGPSQRRAMDENWTDDRRGAERESQKGSDERRKEKDRSTRDGSDSTGHFDHGAAAAGTAAVAGAAALGAKEIHERNQQYARGDRRDESNESARQSASGAKEPSEDDRGNSARRDEQSPDKGAPRRRNYEISDKIDDAIDRKDDSQPRQSVPIDPVEDYRRRVQQERDNTSKATAEDGNKKDGDAERERRRRQEDSNDDTEVDRERRREEYRSRREQDEEDSDAEQDRRREDSKSRRGYDEDDLDRQRRQPGTDRGEDSAEAPIPFPSMPGRRRDDSETDSWDHTHDSQALTRVMSDTDAAALMTSSASGLGERLGPGSHASGVNSQPPYGFGAGSNGSSKSSRRVSIVDPPKSDIMPKSILRKPTEKFPEDPNPIREGVAPLKGDKREKAAPAGAKWTKIARRAVNPQALEEAHERYEERADHVIVLRVLDRSEIQKLADRTKEIRDERYSREHRDRDRKTSGRHHEHEDSYDGRDVVNGGDSRGAGSSGGNEEGQTRAIGWK